VGTIRPFRQIAARPTYCIRDRPSRSRTGYFACELRPPGPARRCGPSVVLAAGGRWMGPQCVGLDGVVAHL
jgi:hypothetical protein